jgi:S1-C subfamily serine protease
MPLVGGFVPDSGWRVIATLAVAIALLFVGYAAGASIGDSISSRFERSPLRIIDRLLGAVISTVAAALVLLLVSTSSAQLGAPFLSQALSTSAVLRTIDDLTPDPVQAFLARVRSIAVQDALPRITEAMGGITESPQIPDVETGSEALTTAARSVVRVSGNAYACGQNQSGSGFVVAKNRVVTNAHVVSGVTELVVDVPGGESVSGTVVYFDPIDDLAVVATKGLSAKPLDLSDPLEVGNAAVFDGYPFGGPFTTGPAKVLAVGQERVDDIYGDSTNPRDIYTIAADVQQGNSGGPLLTEGGDVAGVIFAKSADTANLGYAMTNVELAPVVADASGLSKRADTGACVSK